MPEKISQIYFDNTVHKFKPHTLSPFHTLYSTSHIRDRENDEANHQTIIYFYHSDLWRGRNSKQKKAETLKLHQLWALSLRFQICPACCYHLLSTPLLSEGMFHNLWFKRFILFINKNTGNAAIVSQIKWPAKIQKKNLENENVVQMSYLSQSHHFNKK